MSMLSQQAKELRKAADRFEGYQNGDISCQMREAADTIESLRDRLQEIQGVGGGERETCHVVETIQNQQERIAELERERGEWQFKFCKEAGLHVSDVFQRDDLIRDMYDNLWTHKPKCAAAFAERMRELGIEV